jgi:hypothetical protein
LDVYEDAVITHNSENDTIPLMTTYIFDRTAKYLKGYQSTKFEVGFDQTFSDMAFSVVGYYIQTDHIPLSIHYPYQYTRYRWHGWPQATSKEC